MISGGNPLQRPVTALAIDRLFENTSNDIKKFLLGAASPINVKKNQSVFDRGDSGGTMYVVQAGRVEISLISESGRKMVFNQIGPGHCIGEIGMMDSQPRTASAIAIEDSILLPINRKVFFEAVSRCPQLAINLMEILCERIRWVSDSVEEYALHSLHLRLARRLLVLNKNFADADGAIKIAQSDLADFAGATRESTNKILMEWKTQGLISMGRRKIVLTDLEKLDRIAYWDLGHA
jgi:CRP/FNR family transcriptional regulator, cyclic AMP receptor protein